MVSAERQTIMRVKLLPPTLPEFYLALAFPRPLVVVSSSFVFADKYCFGGFSVFKENGLTPPPRAVNYGDFR